MIRSKATLACDNLTKIKCIMRFGGQLIAATNNIIKMIELINLQREAMNWLNLNVDPILERNPIASLFHWEMAVPFSKTISLTSNATTCPAPSFFRSRSQF